MLFGITLIILGLLAAPSLVLSKHAHAGELLSRIAPYQGWTGLVFCLWGTWGVISCILNIGILSWSPIWWITWLATCVVMALLGFLLGYGMISKLILGKNEEAQAKGEKILKKLAPWQGTLGIAAVIIGGWLIVCRFLFYSIV